MNAKKNHSTLSRQAKVANAKKEHLEEVESELAEVSFKHDKYVSALQAWKECNVVDAVTFSVADFTSAVWKNLPSNKKCDIKNALMYESKNTILRQEVSEFLPSGIDIKITVRSGVDSNVLINNLYQLLHSVNRDERLARNGQIKSAYLGYNEFNDP